MMRRVGLLNEDISNSHEDWVNNVLGDTPLRFSERDYNELCGQCHGFDHMICLKSPDFPAEEKRRVGPNSKHVSEGKKNHVVSLRRPSGTRTDQTHCDNFHAHSRHGTRFLWISLFLRACRRISFDPQCPLESLQLDGSRPTDALINFVLARCCNILIPALTMN